MTRDNFRAFVDELPDLICRYRPDGLLLYVNEAYARFHDRPSSELIGSSNLDHTASEYHDEVEEAMVRIRRLNVDEPIIVNEYRALDSLGRIRWQQWTEKGVFDSDGLLVEVMSVGRDVTDRRAAEEQATYLASHDPLTGLLNRRSVLSRLERLLGTARRRGEQLALMYLDIDDFKLINDAHGHPVGDRVLEEAAERMASAFRSTDLVARVGGDEFVVVCPSVSSDDQLEPIVRRLAATLAEPMLGLGDLSLSISVGWIVSNGKEPAEDLMAQADRAMYEAKTKRSAQKSSSVAGSTSCS